MRRGLYQPFVLDRGLRILCDSGAQVITRVGAAPPCTIAGIPAGQTALLRGLDGFVQVNPEPAIVATGCAGRIHIESGAMITGLSFTGCAQVSLHRLDVSSQTGGALAVEGSVLLATECRFWSRNSGVVSAPGVLIEGAARVTLAECIIVGAQESSPFLAPKPGLLVRAAPAAHRHLGRRHPRRAPRCTGGFRHVPARRSARRTAADPGPRRTVGRPDTHRHRRRKRRAEWRANCELHRSTSADRIRSRTPVGDSGSGHARPVEPGGARRSLIRESDRFVGLRGCAAPTTRSGRGDTAGRGTQPPPT